MSRSIVLSRSIINKLFNNEKRYSSSNRHQQVDYIQGQYVKEGSRIREYFYFISEEGFLFLDDTKHKNFTSCFKDKEFLKFFFVRLQSNDTHRYTQQFPWLSRCGYERNYIRTDDVPIVYTHVIKENLISYNYGGELLSTEFKPQHIQQCPLSGRVYYPTNEKYGTLGLVSSKLAIQLSKNFIFDNKNFESNKDNSTNFFDEPVAIEWNGNLYKLSKLLRPLLINRGRKFD